MNVENFLVMLEINQETQELRHFGLDEEEIQGYIEVFVFNFISHRSYTLTLN